MIQGFDKQTAPLNDYEQNTLLPVIVSGLIYMAGLNVELSWQWTRRGVAFGLYAEQETTLKFDLVIDLKQDNERLTVPRLRRGPNKKRK